MTAVGGHDCCRRCKSQAALLLWSACWFASTAAAAWDPAAQGWTLVRRVGDVDLYRQPMQGSAIPTLLAHARFRAPIVNVFRVISDYDNFAEFVPMVSQSRVLQRTGRTTWVYQRLGLPLLMADRHYIIKIDDWHDTATPTIAVNWQLDESRSRSLSSDRAVLPAAFSGFWRLETLPEQAGCDAVYAVHVEPGGAVPDWLFARGSEHYVVQVIDAVRKRLGAPGR